jgi:hypothetical protein
VAGSNLIDLMQRAIDLMVRLVVGELHLARRLLGWTLAGAITIGVALALLALAGADALAPLIHSRPLRLALVALPLALAGLALLQRGIAGAAADERDRQRDDRQDQQHVNPGAERVAAHHAEQPQDHQ